MKPSQQDTLQETGPHQQPFPAHPVRLDALTASETAKHLAELGVWLRWLTRRYALDHRAIPDCWAEHGALIEELSALHTAWLSAYATTSPGGAPLAWHATFATTRQRLTQEIARTGCRPGEHRQ